jgi:curved DNA-binding protein CbpA
MTHYDTLGVKPDASADEIKTAWRRACSSAHPDREGGSTEQQQAVNKAYEVLGDPERRTHYDQTGNDTAGESIQAEAQSMLVSLFTLAMESDDNWLRAVSQALSMQCAHLLDVQTKAHTKRARLTRRTGKIKVKAGENLVQMLIDDQIRRLDAQHVALERGLEVNQLAAEMLANYEGGEDPPAVPQYAPSQQNSYNQVPTGRGIWSGIFGGQ